MKDDIYFNSEGIYDPTPALAILGAGDGSASTKRFPFRPVVYIASPYSDDPVGNTVKARRYCRFAVDEGYIPFAPHLYLPEFMDEETERDLALFFDRVFLTKCAELWVMGDRVTDGMEREIKQARSRNMTIRYFGEEDIR